MVGRRCSAAFRLSRRSSSSALPSGLCIPQPCRVGLKHAPYLIADTAEAGEDFFFITGRFGRVVKQPVMAICLAGENRARLVRVAANGDDGVNRRIRKSLQVFRAMTGNVNARFAHDLDGQWMNMAGRIRTRSSPTASLNTLICKAILTLDL